MQNDKIVFIESYSDDLIFLNEMREAYLTHPLKNGQAVKGWFDSHCCRFFSIATVGNIESLLEAWIEKIKIDELKEIKKYLCSGEKKQMKEHIKKLESIFNNKNIMIDKPRLFI